MQQPRLYVLVRGDLSKSQQAVQGGHAVAEFCKAEAFRSGWVGRDYQPLPWRWTNGTLVFLKVKDLDELRQWFDKSENPFPFYEPDIGSQMTAFSVLGAQEGFGDLRLI